jgi:hypothetical protein
MRYYDNVRAAVHHSLSERHSSTPGGRDSRCDASKSASTSLEHWLEHRYPWTTYATSASYQHI